MSSATIRTGAEIVFETVTAADRRGATLRQNSQETLIRVLDGSVRLTVGSTERVLVIGEEAIVPAGAAHVIVSEGAAARLLSGLRRAPRR